MRLTGAGAERLAIPSNGEVGALSTRTTGRRYAGQDPGTRRAARREQLMSAGLQLFGTEGYPRVSVKQICECAGLTQRYFYESFDDREALLAAVYERIVTEIGARTLGAIARGGATIDELAHVALSEFIAHLTEDRRSARVMLIEIIGVSPALDERRRRVIHDFADLIVDAGMAHAGQRERRPDFRLAAVGMVGAVNQLLTDWVLGHGDTDPDEIESVCTRVFAATFAAFAVE